MIRIFLTYDVYAYDMILQFVSNVVWRHLFNKTADNLERSMENEDECTILPCTLLMFLLILSVVFMLLWSGHQVLSASIPIYHCTVLSACIPIYHCTVLSACIPIHHCTVLSACILSTTAPCTM
jgi:Transport protein particle (TRAPP) component